jgi:hypothetical protein
LTGVTLALSELFVVSAIACCCRKLCGITKLDDIDNTDKKNRIIKLNLDDKNSRCKPTFSLLHARIITYLPEL